MNIRKISKKLTSIMILVTMILTLLLMPGFTDAKQQNKKNDTTSIEAIQQAGNHQEQSMQETLSPIPIVEKSYDGPVTDKFIIKYKTKSASKTVKDKIKNKIKGSKQIKNKHFKNGLDVITTKTKITKEELLDNLKAEGIDSNIAYIEPDREVFLIPNDSLLSEQWGLGNTSNSASVENVSADVVTAWSESQGEGTIVAIIDSGVDVNHIDLKDNIWINTNEIPDNGIDDDHNGITDDYFGANLIDDNGNVEDTLGHGTAVGGVISAIKNNNEGISGIAPKSQLMVLKAFNNGTGFVSDIIEAFDYAESMGAKIVNCSWTSSVESLALKEAMQESSLLFVCAAGNYGTNNDITPYFPASYNLPNIISVTAIDKNGNLPSYANYGSTTVHVAAPGDRILSTLPGNTYGEKSGTSMAVPFVTGEASLILSKYSNMNAEQIKNKIISTCDPLPSLIGKVLNGNKINCAKAVDIEKDIVTTDPTVDEAVYQQPTPKPTVTDDVYQSGTMQVQAVTTDNGGGTSSVIPVPSEAVNGQLEAIIKGRTIHNLFGSTTAFYNYSTNIGGNSTGVSYSLDESEMLFNTPSIKIVTTHPTVGNAKGVFVKTKGKKFFLSAYVKTISGTIRLYRRDTPYGANEAGSTVISAPTWTRIGMKYDAATDGYYGISTGANTSVLINGIMMVELSEQDYALTTEQLLKKFEYIEGIKSANNFRIKSVGQNLLPPFSAWKLGQDYRLLNDNTVQTNSKSNSDSYIIIPVKPSTVYSMKATISAPSGNTKVNYICMDKNKNIISNNDGYSNDNPNGKITFSTTPDTYYLKIYLQTENADGTFTFENPFLIEGDTIPTQFIPYVQDTFYCNYILKSLPNGVRDTIDLKGQLIKNISDPIILNGNSGWNWLHDYGEYYKVQIDNFGIDNNVIKKTNNCTIAINDQISFSSEWWVYDRNALWINSVDHCLVLVISKSLLPSSDLQGIKNYLNLHPITLIYQYEKPEIIQLNKLPITCFTNGTLIIDHAVKEVGVYTQGTGISVPSEKPPIQYMERVYKVNGNNKIPIDISKVHISPNGMTFTIDGALGGEKYEYVYTYDSSLSVLPEVEFTMPENSDEQISGNTEMIRQHTELINTLFAEIQSLKNEISNKRINVGPFDITITQNVNFDLVVTSSNFKDFSSRKFTIIYDPSKLEVIDLCTSTPALELSGNIGNISILENTSGKIVFTVNNPIQQGTTQSGAVNTIRFRPKTSGTTTISYTAE